VIVIAAAILGAYQLAEFTALAIAAMSMLSLTGIIVTIDAYGPITDNAGGIAEMAELPDSVREVTDPLDAVGNTTKAVTKGYAIASAGLAAICAFCFLHAGDCLNRGQRFYFCFWAIPRFWSGFYRRALAPYLFGASRWNRWVKWPARVVGEFAAIQRNPGNYEGQNKPDYAACVDIVTKRHPRDGVRL